MIYSSIEEEIPMKSGQRVVFFHFFPPLSSLVITAQWNVLELHPTLPNYNEIQHTEVQYSTRNSQKKQDRENLGVL